MKKIDWSAVFVLSLFVLAIMACIFGVIVQIARGIVWIKWAFS